MKKLLASALVPAIAATVIAFTAVPATAQTAKPTTAWPADIDKQSGFRLPLPKREDLSPSGQKTYDSAFSGNTIAGLQGPAGIQLYSPETSTQLQSVNGYLRREAGIPANIREIAILSVARAMSNKFEWAAHEPEARKNGVSESTIKAIKYRRSVKGLPETDALVISLARETFVSHHVSAKTFAAAKQLFGPKKLVDFTLLMGNYAMTGAMLTVFDMQLHKGEVSDLPMP